MKEITVGEFEKVKAEIEKMRILRITLFSEPSHRWMQKVCKHSRRNSKFQGTSSVDWARLVK